MVEHLERCQSEEDEEVNLLRLDARVATQKALMRRMTVHQLRQVIKSHS